MLPIGGLKEKTMAAYRSGITDVIIPKDNESDLAEIESVVKEAIMFHPVHRFDEVLRIALCRQPEPRAQDSVESNDDCLIPPAKGEAAVVMSQ